MGEEIKNRKKKKNKTPQDMENKEKPLKEDLEPICLSSIVHLYKVQEYPHAFFKKGF